ncbi:MAG: hypothetical protein QOJ03_2041 [Frankiaceae bacterium]|jgi:hypothetical protein|nr:hypothetical protein [Frankiaceae bacterium]
MFRPFARLTSVAAVGAVLLVGCGSGSGGSTPSTPKGQLVAGVTALGDADVLTTTLKLDTTADALQALASSSGDTLSSDTAAAIVGAQLVIETQSGKDKAFSVRAVDAGQTLFELRVVSSNLYLQGDLRAILKLAHRESALADVQAQVSQMPDFVRAFVAGDWVSLDGTALAGLAGSLGAPTGSASPAQGPKMIAELKRILSKDVTVRDAGKEGRGEHLVLTGNTRALAQDIAQSFVTSVPGGAAFSDKLKTSDVPSRPITVDAWVKDGALSQISVDLAQFADKADVPAGTTLPITLTFEQSGDDISAPGGATPVDLTQLGGLIGGLTSA